MKRLYSCPECGTALNPNLEIILSAAKGERRGLILLNPQPGNYQVTASDSLQLDQGDQVEFLCPVCQASLQSRVDSNLAEIKFLDEHGLEARVNFSRIYGEHATYFVGKDDIRSYGENAEDYGTCNFFGEGSYK